MSLVTTTMYCPECRDERPVVQPPCADGHDPDCPEWICLEFGHGFWFGSTPPAADDAARVTRYIAA